MAENSWFKRTEKNDALVLLLTVFIIGLCTIVYELLIGSISSYLMGDSIKQFSITIGLSMTAMGLGSLLSRYLKKNLIQSFVWIEFSLGVLGGLSVPLLFIAYSQGAFYYPVMLSLIIAIGMLIGFEIPLLTRIMENNFSLRANISNVLSLDYFGALVAALLFPFVLLPFLGIFKSAILTGTINIAVGSFNLWYFRASLSNLKSSKIKLIGIGSTVFMLGLFISADGLTQNWEDSLYEDRVIFSKQTPYQKIVLTKDRQDLRMYLDGSLQFSSIDEYRYHESLAHIPLSSAQKRHQVLVLGGGEGLLLREILKYRDINEITVVDLDPEVARLGKQQRLLVKLNADSLQNPKVKIVHQDAYSYLEQASQYFDVIIADLPDPKNSSLSRLYSKEFYKLIGKRLSRQGVFATQSTSPFFAKNAFWCIVSSVRAAGFFNVYPYHTYVPSFGDWGFVLASKQPIDLGELSVSVDTNYLESSRLVSLFHFPKDLRAESDILPSSLNQPKVLSFYLEGWRYYN